MRRLRAENVMVLRTDRGALYIYSDSQWISVLVRSRPAHNREGVVMADAVTSSLLCFGPGGPRALTPPPPLTSPPARHRWSCGQDGG